MTVAYILQFTSRLLTLAHTKQNRFLHSCSCTLLVLKEVNANEGRNRATRLPVSSCQLSSAKTKSNLLIERGAIPLTLMTLETILVVDACARYSRSGWNDDKRSNEDAPDAMLVKLETFCHSRSADVTSSKRPTPDAMLVQIGDFLPFPVCQRSQNEDKIRANQGGLHQASAVELPKHPCRFPHAKRRRNPRQSN